MKHFFEIIKVEFREIFLGFRLTENNLFDLLKGDDLILTEIIQCETKGMIFMI